MELNSVHGMLDHMGVTPELLPGFKPSGQPGMHTSVEVCVSGLPTVVGVSNLTDTKAALNDAECALMEARQIEHAATLMFTLNFPILINTYCGNYHRAGEHLKEQAPRVVFDPEREAVMGVMPGVEDQTGKVAAPREAAGEELVEDRSRQRAAPEVSGSASRSSPSWP